jgi:hypothetical protein
MEQRAAVCPYCQEQVKPEDPGVVCVREPCEILTAGPAGVTRKTVDGMSRFFHADCAGKAGPERRPRSAC